MVDVRCDYDKFREAGGDVAVITMGTPKQVAVFRKRLDLPFVCFADPDRNAYRAFGLEQGSLRKVAGMAVWARSFRALIRHGGGMPVGDPMQMQGAFVVHMNGVIQFAHYPQNSADQPRHDDMLQAIRSSTT